MRRYGINNTNPTLGRQCLLNWILVLFFSSISVALGSTLVFEEGLGGRLHFLVAQSDGDTCNQGITSTSANLLFSQASSLHRQAENASPEERVALYVKTLDILDNIASVYPRTDVACRIRAGGSLGQIDIAEMRRTVKMPPAISFGMDIGVVEGIAKSLIDASTTAEKSGDGFLYPNKGYPSDLQRECVALVRALTPEIGATSAWRRGQDIVSDRDGIYPKIAPGTPVATFETGADGRYPGSTGLLSSGHVAHAAAFLSYVKNDTGKIVGMFLLDQYSLNLGKPAGPSFFQFLDSGQHYKDGRSYSVVSVDHSESTLSGPDLVIQNVGFYPEALAPQRQVQVSWTLTNQGNRSAKPSTSVVRINQSSASPAPKINLAEAPAITIEPGQSIQQNAMVMAPSLPGVYHLWVIADNANTSGQTGPAADNDMEMANTGLSVTTGATLTVSKSGPGSVRSVPTGINCGSNCSAPFESGISVTLTANPASGSTFAGWGGACSGKGTCKVTMRQAQNVSATFNANTSSAKTRENASSISCGAVSAGRIEAKEDQHYFRFTPQQHANYVMYTRGSTDTWGELYDERFTRLTLDYDSGGDRNFRIAHALAAGKTYYVLVRGDPGAYTLHVDGPESNYSAAEVKPGTVATGRFEVKQDQHYFRFTPQQHANYVMYTRGSTDTWGELYDERFTRLTLDYDSGGDRNFRIAHSLVAGKTYYVLVRGYPGPYTLHIDGP